MHPDDSPHSSSNKLALSILTSGPLIAVAGVVGVFAVLMVGFVVLYQVAYANRVYPGVRAFGQDLGGYSRDEARLVLQKSLDDLARRQITVSHRELSWSLTAQELGLKTDLAPVLDSVFAIGREGTFFGRFSTQFGLWRQGRTFEQPSAAFDPTAQTAVLERLAHEVARPVLEARLTVKPDYTVELQPAQVGRRLDVDASRRRIQEALSVQGVSKIDLVVEEMTPKNAENNLDRAREQAERILSAPVTLTHEGKVWGLERAQLASILRFDASLEAERAAYLDRAALEAWAKSLADVVNQTPQDARFSWSGGKLEVLRPSRNGAELDVPATVDAIVAASEVERRPVPLPVKATRPAVPMEDRESLGIREMIESSKTPFAGSVQAKQENIGLAARRLNGVVVPPGATFSFNKELGPTTLDSGFKIGWGITTAGGNVKTVPSVAGGICQVATTLFHTIFWSGYPIEERNWHLYWIQSYTSKGVIGLDATVDEEGGLDFQFINPTKNYLLIQSWVDSGQNVNFALYGTRPDWVVKVDPSVKTDVVAADSNNTYVEDEPTMPEGNRLQVERATEGFVVTNVRHVVQNGEDRTLRLVSRYRPSRNVVLVGTGGKPGSGRTVVQQNKPAPAAEEKPAPTPAPSGSPTAGPSTEATAAATATAVPTKTPARATSTPASTRPPATPTPKKP